jgi:hypothetical protein
MIKYGRIISAEHVARMVRIRNACKILAGGLEGTPSVTKRIILKWILQK